MTEHDVPTWRWWTPRALSLSPFTIRVWRVPHRSPLLRRELIALLQGCYALLTFVASQPFMYGQATDIDFMCRSITLAGGLLLLIWSENDRQARDEP